MKIKPALLFAMAATLCAPLTALAGFDEALAAYREKNYPQALEQAQQAAAAGDARASFLLGAMYQGGLGVTASPSEAATWYEKAARGGVLGSFSKLAQMYMRGEGVPKDAEKALGLARQSAQLNDPEGMYLVHVILKNSALGYLDANGKPDEQKYRQLAARPVAQRTLDVEAQDALYLAAEKGYPLAIFSLALGFGGTLGDRNRERMQELIAKVPNHTHAGLKGYERLSSHMSRLGQSLATPQLFYDAQRLAMSAAMLKTCGLQENKEAVKASPPELIAIKVAQPLAEASYLPSNVPGFQKSYLVAGNWKEDWTYKGCGRTASLTITFTADGLGGARFVTEQSGRDIPGLSSQ